MAEEKMDTAVLADPGASAPSSVARRFPIPAWLKQVLPWAVAGAILWFLFRKVAPGQAWSAASQAELRVFVPVALIAVTAWFLLESAAFAYLFSRFNTPLTWGEARSLRAVTYLLTPINWNLGTGAVILHLNLSKRVAAIEATSSVLFYGLLDGTVLGGFALAGVAAMPTSPPIRTVAWIAGGLLCVQLSMLLFFMLPLPPWRWVQRIKALRVFRTHVAATWRDVAVLLAIRVLYFGGFVLFFWAGTRAFNVSVPLMHLAAAVPIILMVGAIPITPAGLGTQQAAMLYFFQSCGSEANILAYGLAFPVALIVGRVVLSLLYVGDLAALRSTLRAATPP